MRTVLCGATIVGLLACSACSSAPPAENMVTVESGKFKMGYDQGRPNGEKPSREVEVDGAYYIGKHEVTNAEYAEFCAATKQPPPASWKDGMFEKGKERHPVTLVTWNDARKYCEWKGGRLPTEAEWEYAARGKDGRLYPWGTDWANGRANNFDAGRGGPVPVGEFKDGAGPAGTLDQAGNVWEWTSTAGDAPNSYVVKGGSYDRGEDKPRTSLRAIIPRDQAKEQVGFRLAGSK